MYDVRRLMHAKTYIVHQKSYIFSAIYQNGFHILCLPDESVSSGFFYGQKRRLKVFLMANFQFLISRRTPQYMTSFGIPILFRERLF
jgi:hypothetical protein